MSSRGNIASDQDQPNKRIRLSEPIAKEEPADDWNVVPKSTAAARVSVAPSTTTPTQSGRVPSSTSSRHVDPSSSTPQTTMPRVKLEDIAGAQQSSRSTSQASHNGKPIPLNLGRLPNSQPQAGPLTPSQAPANGAVRPNPMLTSSTPRYVYPAAATPMMSRTPSAGNGSLPTSANSSYSTPQRVPHPLSGNVAQSTLGRLVPSSAGLRTPNTPNSAFSTTSGMIPGRSVTNLQATPNRASPLSATIPANLGSVRNGSASRAGTPTMGYVQGQPQVVPISRPRTAEDARTIRESEQLLKRFIEMDQKATTQNYVSDEPFRDSRDVVDRLLPFHIWQVHDQDLDIAVKSRERKVAERHQVMQMAAKKIELERRIRALRVKGDENQRSLGYIQIHQAVWPDHRDVQARGQGVIRAAQLENERAVHEYRRRNADILRQDEERRLLESAGKRNLPETTRTTAPGHPGTQSKPNIPPSNVARPNSAQIPAASPLYVPPAHTSKPVDIKVPMAMLTQLTGLNIIPTEKNVAPSLPVPPATIVRTAEDMSHIVISVNLTAVNAQQLAFLAELVKQQAPQRGTMTPNRIGTSSAPAPRPRPPTSTLQSTPRQAGTSGGQNTTGMPDSKRV